MRIAFVDENDLRRFKYLGTKRLRRVWVDVRKERKRQIKKILKKVRIISRFLTDRGGQVWLIISFLSLTKKEIMTIVSTYKIHYRFPLRLVTSGIWATLSQPAQAILPVIGVFANKKGIASPGIRIIAKYSGYESKDHAEVSAGLKELEIKGLMKIRKCGRHHIYYLSEIARWHRGTSFFPILKQSMILNYAWAKFNPSEKALYIVLGLKAKINAARAIDEDCFAIGEVSDINKYCKWAGISRKSFYRAYAGLTKKIFIAEDFDRKYIYEIFIEKDPF
ncbi:unnamed protein product [marine sediment metagenome]|uniref:Uncharacterized protein n=1 Tax=marine sediment metagenome TaxID=412755 RepID=X1SLC6_9ZZZZ